MALVPLRPVFCPTEHRHRGRAIAEEVCAGRYTIHGLSLDLGLEPDWLGASFPADGEWRLEWSRFAYLLDLAWAFRETGDPRLPRAFERLVGSWIDRVPIAHDPTDVLASRIVNWIYALNGFARRAPFDGFGADFGARVVYSIQAQAEHLLKHLTAERTHRTLELYALFIAVLALPQLDPNGELLRFAVARLHANLLHDVLPDGVQRERSTHYHHEVLQSFIAMRENASRFNVPLPDGFDARLTRACEFALHAHRPDGRIPAISDSDSESYLELIARAGDQLGRPDFMYVGTRGARGVPPARMNVSFPMGGYYIQRSGWGDGRTPLTRERFLMFDCGPVGDGAHGHFDALNVEIAAERPLTIDPGRYTHGEGAPHWRQWFKSTAAHNTVTVDGLDQTPHRSDKPRGDVASALLLQRLAGIGIDVLWGEVRSPAYDAIHRRRVMFVGGEYWLIEDRLDAPRPHTYTLRFHLTPDAQDRTSVRTTATGATVLTPDVVLVIATRGSVALESGWIAPTYGTKVAAPVVAAPQSGSPVADFITLVAPLQCHRLAPTLRIEENGGVRTATVHGVGAEGLWRDRVAWSIAGTQESLAGFDCRAAAAWTRECESGRRGPHLAAPVDVTAVFDRETTGRADAVAT